MHCMHDAESNSAQQQKLSNQDLCESHWCKDGAQSAGIGSMDCLSNFVIIHNLQLHVCIYIYSIYSLIRNNKLLGTSASLLVTSALLVVTRS